MLNIYRALVIRNWYSREGLLFLISVGVVVLVSLTAPGPSASQLSGLTWGSLTAEDKQLDRENRGLIDYALTILVLGLVLGIYLYFSFWIS